MNVAQWKAVLQFDTQEASPIKTDLQTIFTTNPGDLDAQVQKLLVKYCLLNIKAFNHKFNNTFHQTFTAYDLSFIAYSSVDAATVESYLNGAI